MVRRWYTDPQYSHGFLVPVFSAYLLWSSRKKLVPSAGGRWLGVALLALGVAIRTAGTLLFFGYLDGISFLVSLAGLAAVWRGRAGLRWAGPAVFYLLFMLPLPYAAQTILTGTLQKAGAQASTYLLVTFGVPAVREGNLILLAGDAKLGVVGACSGLGLAYSAVAIAVAMLFVFRGQAWWVQALLLSSTIPVAVAGNVVRITATGLLYQQSQDATAQAVFHDAAGVVMMPVAAACFCLELWYFGRLIRPRQRVDVAGVLIS